MDKTKRKKQQLTQVMADYLLANGLEQFTLRSLASSIGTSDRMLLHYFVDKNEMLSCALTEICQRLLNQLQALKPENLKTSALLTFLAQLIDHEEMTPYTNLWLELTALSVRHDGIYQETAARIAQTFLAWIESTLVVEDPNTHSQTCAFLFTLIEGMVLLNALGQKETITQAHAWLIEKVRAREL